MSDFRIIIAFLALVAFFNQTPDVNVTVYTGHPFKGIPVSHNKIDVRGRVTATMSVYHNAILGVNNDMCFDNIANWCDTMMVISGLPVHLMTDTYYPNHPIIPDVRACSEKMYFMANGRYY